jgi:hypothetical protein
MANGKAAEERQRHAPQRYPRRGTRCIKNRFPLPSISSEPSTDPFAPLLDALPLLAQKLF